MQLNNINFIYLWRYRSITNWLFKANIKFGKASNIRKTDCVRNIKRFKRFLGNFKKKRRSNKVIVLEIWWFTIGILKIG